MHTHTRNGGNDVYVVLLNAKKAFDTVWFDGLFYQLYLQKIDFGFWHILRSYYKGCQCCVRVGGVHSEWFPVLQGMLQGGVLSMYLYQIFINPMLIQLKVVLDIVWEISTLPLLPGKMTSLWLHYTKSQCKSFWT